MAAALLDFSPDDVSGLSLLKTCDREARTDGPTETLMLSQAPSAHCRDAGKMGQLGFRAKRQGGVWGVGTRDWQVGLEQEGLETLPQLPGGLGHSFLKWRERRVFCETMLKQN